MGGVGQVVRGGPGAPLGQLLAVLQPAVAAAAGLPPWALVAPGPASGPAAGRLICAASLVTLWHKMLWLPSMLDGSMLVSRCSMSFEQT